MDRKLPYELDYKTLKKLRSYETVLLYANIIIPLILAAANKYNCEFLFSVLEILNIVTLVSYAILYILTEIFIQPKTSGKRRKGFLDNSLGSKLLDSEVKGYYDNDELKVGPYKLLVNCFENCFFTKSIIQRMHVRVVCKNLILVLIMIIFSYYGYKDNMFTLPILQLFLSSAFIIELCYHFSFYAKLSQLYNNFIDIFSSHRTKDEITQQAFLMVIEYETTLAYNKSNISDKIYNKINEQLTKEWEQIKTRYGIK